MLHSSRNSLYTKAQNFPLFPKALAPPPTSARKKQDKRKKEKREKGNRESDRERKRGKTRKKILCINPNSFHFVFRNAHSSTKLHSKCKLQVGAIADSRELSATEDARSLVRAGFRDSLVCLSFSSSLCLYFCFSIP